MILCLEKGSVSLSSRILGWQDPETPEWFTGHTHHEEHGSGSPQQKVIDRWH